MKELIELVDEALEALVAYRATGNRAAYDRASRALIAARERLDAQP